MLIRDLFLPTTQTSQTSSNADVSTTGLQFALGLTLLSDEDYSPAVEMSAFHDEGREAISWLVERELRST